MDEKDELQRCIKTLEKGGLIVVPSDTVYGLACDGTNERAVEKLIRVKNRPWGKPISVFVGGFEMLEQVVETSTHAMLLNKLLPGPFTVILPSRHSVSHLLESERKTLGVRYTSYSWIQELVSLFKKPLTATSANISGRPPHYDANGFMNELSAEKRSLIDLVIDKGKLPHNKPSTIIDLTGSSLRLLRKGEVLPISQHSFTSTTAHDTKKIAQFLIGKYIHVGVHKPLVFVLEGDMGVGKTVFAQGLGEFLRVEDVISPTYVIYYEYPVMKDGVRTFLHADLFNIEETEEFSHLGLEGYLKAGNVMCVEWGDRIGPLFEEIKNKAKVIMISMSYKNETDRVISMQEL